MKIESWKINEVYQYHDDFRIYKINNIFGIFYNHGYVNGDNISMKVYINKKRIDLMDTVLSKIYNFYDILNHITEPNKILILNSLLNKNQLIEW
ncbi:MAG: hypothetical protein Q8K30_05160 [Candidatus Gracilibacteria bacterium]|nr:hypothetical protein [Candidatus Gracilibacteria bacterium]